MPPPAGVRLARAILLAVKRPEVVVPEVAVPEVVVPEVVVPDVVVTAEAAVVVVGDGEDVEV